MAGFYVKCGTGQNWVKGPRTKLKDAVQFFKALFKNILI